MNHYQTEENTTLHSILEHQEEDEAIHTLEEGNNESFDFENVEDEDIIKIDNGENTKDLLSIDIEKESEYNHDREESLYEEEVLVN